MSELAIREETGIFARVERTKTSLVLPLDLEYDEYEELLASCAGAESAILWWQSDALNQGGKLYGHIVEQAAELLGRSPRTLINRASIAHRIPPERRNPKIHFSKHEPVAKLEPAEQVQWLKICEEENLTRDQLYARVNDGKIEQNVLPPAVPTLKDAAWAVWHSSRRMVGNVYAVDAEVMLTLKEALGE